MLQIVHDKYKNVVSNPLQRVVDDTQRGPSNIPRPVSLNKIPIPDNAFQEMLNADVQVPGLLNVLLVLKLLLHLQR